MDRGDMTLGRFYPKYQDALDSVMKNERWNISAWISEVFPGAAHIETDWAM